MTTLKRQTFTDAQRMEVRSYVQLAREVIAQYWPMRTFIHHNPLHGLEGLHFEAAVKRGAQLFGGRGYLSNETFRRYFKSGRISPEDLQATIEPLAAAKQVTFSGRATSHFDVLMASIVHGISERRAHQSDPPHPEEDQAVRRIESWLKAVGADITPATVPLMPWESVELPLRETCAAWCDRTIGTTLVDTINREMVKWCSAFLDEGEASWAMPDRGKKFYQAWKSLALHDMSLRLIGIRKAAQKVAALSDRSEDALLESLTILKIPKAAWEEYLAHHLAALPGWAGYIKWRVDQDNYPWQQQQPIDLVKYLAVRLFYERELVDRSCREELGIPGDGDAIRAYMDSHPHAYWFRREWVAGSVATPAANQARQLTKTGRGPDADAWDDLGREQFREANDRRAEESVTLAARRLLDLAR
ncbi:MAG: putative inorganic carbon transporter subunit DabA, partial [Nitrospira sp.]